MLGEIIKCSFAKKKHKDKLLYRDILGDHLFLIIISVLLFVAVCLCLAACLPD